MTGLSSTSKTCPQCGSAIAVTASEGLCPRCLVAGVLARGTPKPSSADAILDADDAPSVSGGSRRFGDYELLEVIARGGMGVVYRARQISLNRSVALKMIRAGELAGADEVRRFRLEAEAAAQLEHPNIIPIYEVGEHEGRHYFAMKLAEGGSLSVVAASRQGAANVGAQESAALCRDAATLVTKVARAVHFAHQHGILHRDLKPANVLLDRNGEPMVSDFGLAKFPHGDFTLSGTTLGTPAYMSPEQAAGKTAQVTTASDVYSLGAMLYHLLAGQPPFSGANALELLRRLSDEDPPSLIAIRPQIARDLETICLKCLEKDPARRYTSAAALADDLERWLRHEPLEARPSSVWQRGLKWVRRKPAQAALLAVSIIGVAAFVALLLAGDARLKRERDFARTQEHLAKAQANRADASALRATQQTRRAETNEMAARLNLYAADIFLARRALDEGNLGVARRTLAAHVPQAGQTDLRGFEWHYLWRLSQGDDAIVLRHHSKAVTSLVFSRDGRTLVSAGRDGQVRFCSVADATPGRVIPVPDTPRGLAERPMMTAVLAASPEALALLTTGGETLDGMTMRSRPATLGDVRAVAWSLDGQWFATGGDGSYARVWNASNLVLEFVIPAHNTRAVAFTPNHGHLILAEAGPSQAREASEVRIYDMATHHRVRTLTNVQPCFALSPDGQTLALARKDATLELQTFPGGDTRRVWAAALAADALAFSPDGRLLVALESSRGEVHLWNADSGKSRGKLSASRDRLWALAFSPDGQTLATVGSDHAVRLWDLETFHERQSLLGHEDEVLAVAFAPAGNFLATAGKDNSVRLWSLGAWAGKERRLVEAREPICVAQDGEALLMRSQDGNVQLWNVPTQAVIPVGDAGRREVLGFTRNAQTFATLQRGANNQATQIEFWNNSGEPDREPVILRDAREDWSIMAGTMAAGLCAVGHDREVTVHDAKTGERLQQLRSPRRRLSRLLFSDDGQSLLAFAWPNQLLVWETSTGAIRSAWRTSEGAIQALAFSQDGRLIVSGGDDNLISVWDAANGARVTVLRGHKAEIKALAFTPDGRTLASSSADLTLKLWHVPTWRELGTLRRDGLFTFLAFAGEGPTLFAGEYRGPLHALKAKEE